MVEKYGHNRFNSLNEYKNGHGKRINRVVKDYDAFQSLPTIAEDDDYQLMRDVINQLRTTKKRLFSVDDAWYDEKAFNKALDYIYMAADILDNVVKDRQVFAEPNDLTEGVRTPLIEKFKVNFKDLHICDGCGKPLSQCSCSLGGMFDESLNEDIDDDAVIDEIVEDSDEEITPENEQHDYYFELDRDNNGESDTTIDINTEDKVEDTLTINIDGTEYRYVIDAEEVKDEEPTENTEDTTEEIEDESILGGVKDIDSDLSAKSKLEDCDSEEIEEGCKKENCDSDETKEEEELDESIVADKIWNATDLGRRKMKELAQDSKDAREFAEKMLALGNAGIFAMLSDDDIEYLYNKAIGFTESATQPSSIGQHKTASTDSLNTDTDEHKEVLNETGEEIVDKSFERKTADVLSRAIEQAFESISNKNK